MRDTKSERIFHFINTIFLTIVAFICLAPMLYILAVSFSANEAVTSGQVTFWPKEFTTIAYTYLMANKLFWYALLNSIKRIVLGVGLNILCTILVAYPLSKDSRKFKMRNLWAWFFFIPMIFSGGIIPWFILIKELKLINSIWALVLPGAVSPFYIVVLLNFFRGIPAELEEAAIIDGCGYWRILFQIYLPLSLPAIATIAVFAILAHWNSWFDGLILMSEPKNYPLITYLQTAVININYERLTEEEIRRLALLGGSSYKAAQLFAGSLPVILSYPFLQRYFIKGLTLGSIKG